jgi:hypothetical protein
MIFHLQSQKKNKKLILAKSQILIFILTYPDSLPVLVVNLGDNGNYQFYGKAVNKRLKTVG